MYLIINRIFTCIALGIDTYKYGPCLNNSSIPKSGLIGILYIIQITFIELWGFTQKKKSKLWGYSKTYNKWYDLCLFNIRNLEGVIKNLKWLEQGDKTHIKCFFLYNESVFLRWLWFVLLSQTLLIY